MVIRTTKQRGYKMNTLTLSVEKDTELREKAIALYKLLGREALDFEPTSYNDNEFECSNTSYLVVTDDEAEELWDEELDNYLEECVYPQIPDDLVNYFDDEKWKRDARMDGRGHALSHYDGDEHEIKVNNTYYYIYRTN